MNVGIVGEVLTAAISVAVGEASTGQRRRMATRETTNSKALEAKTETAPRLA
jgi:hypothetical protein